MCAQRGVKAVKLLEKMVFCFFTGGPLAAAIAKKKLIVIVKRFILPPGVLNVSVNL